MITYFLAGIGTAYVVTRIMNDSCQSKHITVRHLKQAVGPDDLGEDDLGEDDLGEDDLGEDDLGEDDLGEDDLGEDDLGEDDLGEDDLGNGPEEFGPAPAKLNRKGGLGGSMITFGNAAPKAAKGLNLQPRRVYSTSNTPNADVQQFEMRKHPFTAPVPKSKTVAKQVAKAKIVAKAKAKAKVAAKAKAKAIPKSKFVKSSMMPEISNRDHRTVLPKVG